MQLTEKHYTSTRGDAVDDYQTLDVIQETEKDAKGKCRDFIRFKLMETRWRSIDEAAAYLRWAAEQLETLK